MKDNIEIKNKEDLIKQISKEKYGDEYFIEKAILTYKFQQGKTYTFFRDDSKDNLINKYNWCQRPHEDNMSLHRFISNGEIEAHMSESLAEYYNLIKIDLNEFIFKFVQPIVKENIELKSRLKTAERMNDVLADELNIITDKIAMKIGTDDFEFCDERCHNEDECGECKQCIIEWARKKVEDE